MSKRNSVKLIHEVHDMWPATLVEMGGMSRNNPFVKLLQVAEDSAYSKSDAVVSILPHAEEYMIKHGLKKDCFYHIPNGVTYEDLDNPMDLPIDLSEALISLKSSGKKIICYFGGHAISNALDVMLDVAKLAEKDDEYHFILVGNGVEKPRLLKRCEDEGLKNVTFFDPIPKRSVPNLLNLIDLVYITVADSSLYRFGLGLNKFYDAMCAAKPIVLSATTPETIIEKYNCGFVVPSEEPLKAYEAIRSVFELPEEEFKKLGQNGKAAVAEYFMIDSLAKDFENIFKNEENKNILLINHYAGSPKFGMEFRPYYFAREWVKMGYRVDIIAADFSHLRKENPVIKKDFEEELIDGIHYHWIKTNRYEGNGIKRAITMFQFTLKIRKNAKMISKEFNPGVIIDSSTYPLDTYAGQKIKKICNKKK